MEIKGLLSVLFCLQLFLGFSQSSFEKGNVFYAQNKYTQAVEAYKTHLASNPYDYVAYYNLGNSYYQNENYALSLWAYEKALKIKPNFDEAQLNAKKTFGKTRQSGNWNNSTYWLFRVLFSVGINFWAYIASATAILLSITFFLYFRTEKSELKKALLIANFVLLFILLSTVSLSGAHYNRLHKQKYAIVISNNTHAKVAPNWNGKTAFDLPAGRKIKILQQNAVWAEVELNKSHTGWVSVESIAGI